MNINKNINQVQEYIKILHITHAIQLILIQILINIKYRLGKVFQLLEQMLII